MQGIDGPEDSHTFPSLLPEAIFIEGLEWSKQVVSNRRFKASGTKQLFGLGN
ncbi:MAG TPA: hypothetical protein VLJ11_10490 [Bryobacteraceae bacterium]|nr:hypothetical protein [Bryobacteraceae bacterium]